MHQKVLELTIYAPLLSVFKKIRSNDTTGPQGTAYVDLLGMQIFHLRVLAAPSAAVLIIHVTTDLKNSYQKTKKKKKKKRATSTRCCTIRK